MSVHQPADLVLATTLTICAILFAWKLIKFLFGDGQWKGTLFRHVTNLPLIRGIKENEVRKAELDIFQSIHGKTEDLGYRTSLPANSKSKEQVLKEAMQYQSTTAANWEDGAMSGTVYPSDKELNDLLIEVM